MTNEFPWAATRSNEGPSTTTNDALEVPGSSHTPPSFNHVPAVMSSDEAQTLALSQSPSSHSTDFQTQSRREMRETERSLRTNRRGPRRTESAPVVAASPIGSVAQKVATAALPRPVAAPAARTLVALSAAERAPIHLRVAQKAFPPVVLVAASALLVSTSLPATALFDPDAPPASTVMASIASSANNDSDLTLAAEQVLTLEASTALNTPDASRDDWSVTSYAEMLRLKYGSRDFSYSTSGSGAVRWPFAAPVPINSGFGERVAPCRSCSSYHQGLDFGAGSGSPIFSIADGVVIQSEYSGGFGQHAIIEHTINGQRVQSIYAHMTGGSSPLVAGQEVRAGDLVGTVGNTGVTTGAHLHFEIHIDDIAIDPFAWLQSNAS